MQHILQQFQGHSIRIVQENGETRFVLKDLCAVLGLGTPAAVAKRLDEDEKGMNLIHTPGGEQRLVTVNESGLYAVILRSDKPVAREFRKWVTNEVLPALRQTGTYTIQQAAPALDLAPLQQIVNLTAAAINASEQKVMAEIDQRIQQFVDESPVSHSRALEIKKAIERLARLMGGKPYHFRTAWTNFKDRFQLPAYKDLPNRRFEEAMKFIRDMAAAYEGPQALEFDA